MKTKVETRFNGRSIPGGEQVVLKLADCGPDVARVEDIEVLHKTFVEVDLYADDPRLPVLRQLLEERGVEWREWRRDEYTEAELDAAPLLITWYDNNETVFGGPRLGTTYDMSEACKRCGAGARQTSAMVIDGEDLHKLEGRRAAATYYDDMLVEEKLADTLAASGLTGISFRGVFAAFEKRGHIQLPWRQLCAAHTMPPMSPRSTGFEPRRVCPSCGRSGLSMSSEVPTRLTYRASDVADIQDVNLTWEWYGEVDFDGDVSNALFPCPLFLVTPKIRRIFLDAGATDFNWIPIRVVDE